MASIIEILALGTATTQALIKAYYILFAVLTIVGGVMGYVKAKSRVSLVAGSLSGILLVAASIMLSGRHPVRAYIIGLLVSVLLAGKFVPDYVHKKALIPGGLMALLSLAGIVITLVGLVR